MLTQICTLLNIIFALQGCYGGQHESKLYNDLIVEKGGYTARPVLRYSEPVIMYMNLSLTQILDVDEKNQMVTVNVWVTQEWTDHTFKWNPMDYGNISDIKVPTSDIWIPDLVLYNNAGGSWDLASTSNTKVKISHDSKITWKPPIIYQLACDIDVKNFPFDTQSCKLKMGTWTHNGYAIDLRHTAQKASDEKMGLNKYDDCRSKVDYAIDISEYQENGEWDLIEVSAKRNIQIYNCCPEPFLDITYLIVIRRRTLFFGTNLIAPCIAVSFCILLVFYQPSDSLEKITLTLSVLIALEVFLLLVFDLIPTTSIVVPLISKYLLFIMLIITLSIIAATIVLNVRYRSPDTNQISPWLRAVFIDILPKVLFMRREQSEEFAEDQVDDVIDTDNQSCDTALLEENALKDDLESEIRLALKAVKMIAANLKSSGESDGVKDDWKYIALVLDRLCLVVFSSSVFAGICGILFQLRVALDYKEPLLAEKAQYLESTLNYTRLC